MENVTCSIPAGTWSEYDRQRRTDVTEFRSKREPDPQCLA
jgi:hypothetical protein